MKPIHGVDVRLSDVAVEFDRLNASQKQTLIIDCPALYFAVARLVRRWQIEGQDL